MHIGIFADIEGSFGIWRMRQCRMGTPEWQYGRYCLTEDVNHVIQGAFDGGADTVTVKDTHELGFNCLPRKLDKRARYVGGHYTTPSLFGKISDYDLVLYVAIHAASGTENAFFPHTHYGIFSEIKVNNTPACEMDIYAAYLGEFDIPVGFVSGEDIAVRQALDALPWAKSVVVDKRRDAYTNGEKSIRYLAEGRKQLRQTTARAVKDASQMKPLIINGPIVFEAEFRSKKLATRFNTWHFHQTENLVTWEAKNMIEGFEMLNKLTFIPKKVYPFRRPLAFAIRNFFRIKTAYFAPDPNSEDAALP
ncbi:MAG: M55 family metallopeptidase [Desulfobacteraceae bacterium]|nr:M55 family metallopeptidase [Desulfobacteraceae bacterium]MBC2755449.1 M55 family metallopeptidase [Desulfobacteraceae bacterium]